MLVTNLSDQCPHHYYCLKSSSLLCDTEARLYTVGVYTVGVWNTCTTYTQQYYKMLQSIAFKLCEMKSYYHYEHTVWCIELEETTLCMCTQYIYYAYVYISLVIYNRMERRDKRRLPKACSFTDVFQAPYTPKLYVRASLNRSIDCAVCTWCALSCCKKKKKNFIFSPKLEEISKPLLCVSVVFSLVVNFFLYELRSTFGVWMGKYCQRKGVNKHQTIHNILGESDRKSFTNFFRVIDYFHE